MNDILLYALFAFTGLVALGLLVIIVSWEKERKEVEAFFNKPDSMQ